MITELTGDSYVNLLQSLTWMPAHTLAADAGLRSKSSGKAFTTSEWRANQLADMLAKGGASSSAFRIEADRAIKSAGNALLHSAARSGVVTLDANAYVVESTDCDGKAVRITKRLDTNAACHSES